MSYVGVGPVVEIDSIGEEPDINGSRKRIQSDADDKTGSKKIRDHTSQELDELGDLTSVLDRSKSSDWIVDLPDDDTESMQIMLNMMHARFDWVPQSISVQELYEMLVLVDKYDALDVIRPWAQGWADALKDDLEQPALLWIASELGDSELFEIINHARKELLMLELLPYWSVIQEIHTGGYTQRLIDPETMDGEMCLEYANDHYDCGATLLSRLLNGFHRLDRQEQLPVGNGLQGSGFAHHYRKTVTALRDTLAKATFFEIEHPMAYEGTTCDGCAEWIETTLQKEQEARDPSKILSSIRSVSEDHQGYMAQRGAEEKN
ncbi:hypothetical protein COL922a_013648 [Colletotrichum nupharicola]|nr:hypothetical protein COL922a_013648 [Colletotrichum nupharicola]